MQQQERIETGPVSRVDRAGMITALNQQLVDIKNGRIPGDNREEVLARKRALSAEQAFAKIKSKLPYGPRP